MKDQPPEQCESFVVAVLDRHLLTEVQVRSVYGGVQFSVV